MVISDYRFTQMIKEIDSGDCDFMTLQCDSQVEEILEKTLFEAKVRTIDLDNTVAKALEQVIMICDGYHDDGGGGDDDHGDDDYDYDDGGEEEEEEEDNLRLW